MKYILVLGQRLNPNASMHETLKRRLKEAYKYYNEDNRSLIICSGGDVAGVGLTEATMMMNYLIRLGVPENNIFLDPNAMTTYDNLNNFKNVYNLNPVSGDLIIITSNFHVDRVIMLAGIILGGIAMDISVVGVPNCLSKKKRSGENVNDFSDVENINNWSEAKRINHEKMLIDEIYHKYYN